MENKKIVPGIAKLSMTEFRKLSEFIYREYGIKLPDVKKTMLEGRLQKRLKANSITTFKDYVDFVFSDEGKKKELIHMIDVVTTNKTDFFREPAHFDYLTEVALPEILKDGSRKNLKIWSAGCSSGEEPYTIAMVFEEFKEDHPLLDYQIFASDISTRILQDAVNAVYKMEKVAPVPMYLKKKYLLKSKNPDLRTVRIVPKLRNKVRYGRINFMDASYPIEEKFDIIFCRNVIIYFDRKTQEEVINKLARNLKTGGYFFLGHSESIANMNVPLRNMKPTIFRKI
jgi:chemotaxis protein methyltransferase CheR